MSNRKGSSGTTKSNHRSEPKAIALRAESSPHRGVIAILGFLLLCGFILLSPQNANSKSSNSKSYNSVKSKDEVCDVSMSKCSCPYTHEFIEGSGCVTKCAAPLERGAGTSCVMACAGGYERVKGVCQPPCFSNQERNKGGQCVAKSDSSKKEKKVAKKSTSKNCKFGEELVKNTCVAKCSPGFERLKNGSCTVACAAGSERIGSKCVTACTAGLERVNGACITACQPGYDRVSRSTCAPACAENFKRNSAGQCVYCPNGKLDRSIAAFNECRTLRSSSGSYYMICK